MKYTKYLVVTIIISACSSDQIESLQHENERLKAQVDYLENEIDSLKGLMTESRDNADSLYAVSQKRIEYIKDSLNTKK